MDHLRGRSRDGAAAHLADVPSGEVPRARAEGRATALAVRGGFRHQGMEPATSGPETDFWVMEDMRIAVPRVEVSAGFAPELVTHEPIRYEDMPVSTYDAIARPSLPWTRHASRGRSASRTSAASLGRSFFGWTTASWRVRASAPTTTGWSRSGRVKARDGWFRSVLYRSGTRAWRRQRSAETRHRASEPWPSRSCHPCWDCPASTTRMATGCLSSRLARKRERSSACTSGRRRRFQSAHRTLRHACG